MMPDITLRIDGGSIRPLLESDAHQVYVDGLNDPVVNRFLEVRYFPQTMKTVRSFIAENNASQSAVLFGIWHHSCARHIGTLRIHGIGHRCGEAHIGVCIFDRQYWGRGLGSAAIAAATRWAFEALELRWIEAGAYEANVASQRAFLSAGYAWVFDIPGKYLLEGEPTTVKVFAARRQKAIGA